MGTAGQPKSQPEASPTAGPVSAEEWLPTASSHPAIRNLIFFLALPPARVRAEGPGASQAARTVSSLQGARGACGAATGERHHSSGEQRKAMGHGASALRHLAALGISGGPGQGQTAQTGTELCQGLAPHGINATVSSLACKNIKWISWT